MCLCLGIFRPDAHPVGLLTSWFSAEREFGMSDTKPWTVAMMAVLEDGEWHNREDILMVGAAVVPADRALLEMGERSLTSTPERRVSAGARTVALQALQGRRRFQAVEFSKDGKVRKSPHEGVANFGAAVERVAKLEDEVAELRAIVTRISAKLGLLVVDAESAPGGDESDAGVVIEILDRVNGGA